MIRRMGRGAGLVAMLCFGGAVITPASHAQTVILYANNFERPNVPLEVNCGNALDDRGINFLYGSADFQFVQDFSVEAVFLQDPTGLYRSPGAHGDYAIGMLSDVQDDRLALAFDSKGNPFINVGLDLSSIDVQGCGGPFGVTAPKLRISLIDRPDGIVDYSQAVLDSREISGVASQDAWTFQWKNAVIGLSTAGSRNGDVTIVFDLLEGGYAVFDNLSITASMQSEVVDIDLDGLVDDQDNCPTQDNPDQSNLDGDASGDACDPAPTDPAECGDPDRDGFDDCSGAMLSPPTAGTGTSPMPPRDAGVDGRPPSGAAPDAGSAASAQQSAAGPAAGGCRCAMPGERGRDQAGRWMMGLLFGLALFRRLGRSRGRWLVPRSPRRAANEA